jgi:phage terminase small subunit
MDDDTASQLSSTDYELFKTLHNVDTSSLKQNDLTKVMESIKTSVGKKLSNLHEESDQDHLEFEEEPNNMESIMNDENELSETEDDDVDDVDEVDEVDEENVTEDELYDEYDEQKIEEGNKMFKSGQQKSQFEEAMSRYAKSVGSNSIRSAVSIKSSSVKKFVPNDFSDISVVDENKDPNIRREKQE